MMIFNIFGFAIFCIFNFIACYVAYHIIIDELTLKQIYDLKVKTLFPVLLSKQEKILLQAVATVTDFKTYFKTETAKNIHATIIDILAFYETKKVDNSEISHFITMKILPLQEILQNYKKDIISIHNVNELLSDIDANLKVYKSKLISKSDKINKIELKVLKSFYN